MAVGPVGVPGAWLLIAPHIKRPDISRHILGKATCLVADLLPRNTSAPRIPRPPLHNAGRRRSTWSVQAWSKRKIQKRSTKTFLLVKGKMKTPQNCGPCGWTLFDNPPTLPSLPRQGGAQDHLRCGALPWPFQPPAAAVLGPFSGPTLPPDLPAAWPLQKLPRPLATSAGAFPATSFFSYVPRLPPGFGKCFFLWFPRVLSASLKTFPGPTAASCGLSKPMLFLTASETAVCPPQNPPRPLCSVQGPFQPPAFSPTFRDCRLASANAFSYGFRDCHLPPSKPSQAPLQASRGLSSHQLCLLRSETAAWLRPMLFLTVSETAVCLPQDLPRPHCSVLWPF